MADSSQAALQQIERTRPDLVLLDIQMPELDGFELARTVREGEAKSGRYLPIVALTSEEDDAEVQQQHGVGQQAPVHSGNASVMK